MRRALLAAGAALLLTLALAPAAGAHRWMKQHGWASERLEQRMDEYRLRHGHHIVLPSLQTMTANIALGTANYEEGRWTTRIAGVPFTTWSAGIYGHTRGRAIIKRIRCYDQPFTPLQAIRELRRSYYYRFWMLSDLWTFGSGRAVSWHEHRGAYRGKGVCRAYYFSFST